MRLFAVITLAAIAASVAAPAEVDAQNTTYLYITENYPKFGVQLAVDHWRSCSTCNNFGTNFGAGIRYETELPIEHVRSYLDTHVFVGNKMYADATVNIIYSFDFLRSSVTPFAGVGGMLLVGGDAAGVSLDIAAGVQLRRAAKNIPFVEARYITSGGRIVAILGMLF
jgi:hypothetical protein